MQNQELILSSVCIPSLLAFASWSKLCFLPCILPLQMCPDLPFFWYEKQLRFLIAFLIYGHACTFPEGYSLPVWFHSICIKLTLFTLLINSLYNERDRRI